MRAFRITIAALLLVAAAVFAAWASAPDPRFNPASFEDEPLDPGIAPVDVAITLAQFRGEDGTMHTLVVTGFDDESVTGIDLAALGGTSSDDPFAALATADLDPLRAGNTAALPQVSVAMTDLLPTGTSGDRHIGTGTNFPEHAEEANSGSVFQFPKFGPARPARTVVKADPGILLDYEVELCMRFDRDIASAEDFDAAQKGVFLCGDFTNRNALVELADPDNLDSGSGFSDSKSGPHSFPTGPFLVIPADWNAFVADLRMTTTVNGAPRQDAHGREMTMDFRALAQKALGDMDRERFLYRGGYHRLAADGRIDTSMTLMSGTSEGVIFTGPTRADYIEAALAYLGRGGPLSGVSLTDTGKRVFIANELASGHFLQPGDVVRHGSSYLGDIEVRVVE